MTLTWVQVRVFLLSGIGVGPFGSGLEKISGDYPLTVGTAKSRLIDDRFGSGDRYYLSPPKDIDMRVPDAVLKTVLFLGNETPAGVRYKGTAYIVALLSGPGETFTTLLGEAAGTIRHPVFFMVTARHVAEELEGVDFFLRANKKDGTTQIVRKGADETRWWYHPTEKEFVDAAATFLSGDLLSGLDFETIPISMFLDEEKIKSQNIGVGDDVFIAGLFTKIVETSKNIPIVRTGNIAMMPGERIPFGKKLGSIESQMIDAYLVESRSIGGLSGSPVFVRETSNTPFGRMPGRFYFLGSMIGHWQVPPGFTPLNDVNNEGRVGNEAVNMGIAPVAPAVRIREVILQHEILMIMKNAQKTIDSLTQADAVLDSAKDEQKPFTKEDFEGALRKASRKIAPDKK